MDYGLQMFSVRDIAPDNMDGALRMVSEIGYKFVEFAGFFGIPAKDIRAMLDKHGLTVSGTHTGWQEVADHFAETVAYHKAIGNVNIIVPGADLKDQVKIDAFVKIANECQPKLASEGFTFGYHNHYHEFHANEDGSVIYDQLVERTNLRLELDTGWAYSGGQDAVKMMERLKHRLHFIHLRDSDSKGVGAPLGQGTAPVRAVHAKAVELNVPMVVESEAQSPDSITGARMCMDFLKTLK